MATKSAVVTEIHNVKRIIIIIITQLVSVMFLMTSIGLLRHCYVCWPFCACCVITLQ